MTSSSDNELEFFQDLDELIIDQTASTPKKTSPRELSPDQNSVTSKSTGRLQISNESAGNRRTRAKPGGQKRTQSLSEEDICDFLQGAATERQEPQQSRTVSRGVQPDSVNSLIAVQNESVTPEPVHIRTRPLKAQASRIQTPLRWLTAMIAICAVGWLVWFLSARAGGNDPQIVQGAIRFEGPAPPAAFIQLLRLNSPREEDFVAEIRDGQFTFPKVPPGDYALWLATADGTPIPVRPVGTSVGLLTEAEHHLCISLSNQPQTFAFEFTEKANNE